MSSIVKSNGFTQNLIERISNDAKFKGGRSYYDLSVWTQMCTSLSDNEVFSVLPVALMSVWSDEVLSSRLLKRGAHKADRHNIQSLAATLVSFRRTQMQNDEIVILQKKLSHLSNEFNNLSGSVFDILNRLDRLEDENAVLKQVLKEKGILRSHKEEVQTALVPTASSAFTSDKEAVTTYVL